MDLRMDYDEEEEYESNARSMNIKKTLRAFDLDNDYSK